VRTAVVLFNLGGPDSPEAVRPFLENLFGDPAIMTVPQPFRSLLAWVIAKRRAPVARAIYAQIGGRSPILENTQAQARALEQRLGGEHRCFIAMRYWHPRAAAVAEDVAAWEPEHVVMLPLYPQYSTTTTASSFREWERAARRSGIGATIARVCCWPREDGFVSVVRRKIAAALEANGDARVLFSAHGLPEKTVRGGDPYQWQVEQTVRAIVDGLGREVDHVVCYQSRVGPLAWIGPSTDAEIRRAGAEKRKIIVAPVSFVSEHSETLVELDIEYGHLAREVGVPSYLRLPTVDAEETFIAALARLVRAAAAPVQSGEGGRVCPSSCVRCAFA
jgi:protoporphyrin/coproporphyrin ferrochelatase